MAELAQAADVYAPRTLPAWRSLLNWLLFFFQIFVQIVRGPPSLSQVLSYVGLRNTSFLSSTPQFMPLPIVELPESQEPPHQPPLTVSTLQIAAGRVPDANGEQRLTRISNSASKYYHYFHVCSDIAGSVISNTLISVCMYVEEASYGMGKPPPSPGAPSEVVLDLDETLVCAYETSSLPNIVRTQATEAGLKWFELECTSSDKECEGKPKINYVTVFERPGLHEFLKELSEFANLVLFTAGLEGYARPLVDKIDVGNRFSLRLYRPSTISTSVLLFLCFFLFLFNSYATDSDLALF
ncbi:hypothetical protein MTR67_026816 [Solanum verrucosum]|uniref:Mitochondrial import inner membrane translocase subunit TIM50 n=1 Tax=Solanum verrucosum TaxID=315347 RepID=A0AAF0R808_SOLVR|nr:hypothetical protein MTR67_026816 [Solanum verrucosum]